MTFGVTPEGFKAKKFDDIIQELAESLKTQLGIDIDSSPDSVSKVITNIYALALAEEWALPQALQSMFDIDKAEGKHLDDLVGYVGLTRLQEAASSGRQYVSSSVELTVPQGSIFTDISGGEYTNINDIFVSLTNCVDCRLSVAGSVIIGDILTVIVNGVTSSVTVTGAGIPTAISTLANDINSKSNGVSAGVISDEINIVADDDKTSAVITTTSNIITESITSFGIAEAVIVGEISVPASTVINAPSVTGIDSTTNRYDYTVGRVEESDQDLRNRHALSLATAGAATVEAIRADLLGVVGVTTAFVIENDSINPLVLTSDTLPPKSFLSVVKGGEDQAIGDALWLTKPAGIESHGSIDVTVVDSQGKNQSVSFSRPIQTYVHMRVDYTIYSEESDEFPVDGEQQMLNQILTYGDGLDVGEDVIPQRFSSQIFQSIGGLQRVDIYIGSTAAPDDPTPVLSNITLPIDELSEANFDEVRITFVEV